MANKPVTVDTATGAQVEAATYNANNAVLEDAIENGLGRGGTAESNNSMAGNLDMDLNEIKNLGDPQSIADATNKRYVDAAVAAGTSGTLSASEILTLLKSVDGDGSGLDADLVKGLESATSATASTVVVRDASGDFAANEITADLVGDVTGNTAGVHTGNVTGDVTGNADTATALLNYGVLHVQHRLTSGTAGGATLGGSTEVRPLNTVVKNTITGASLATNQITLPAGEYKVVGSCVFALSNSTQTHLYNVTAASTVIYGVNGFVNQAANYTDMTAYINGTLTLAVESVLEYRYQVTNTNATGLGRATSFGRDECYASLLFERIA